MEATAELSYALNTFYFLVCGALVMWMAAGFAMLEAGLVRSKNTTEILTKNVVLFAIACTMYMVVGYDIMYGGGVFLDGLAADGVAGADEPAGYAPSADFFFQVCTFDYKKMKKGMLRLENLMSKTDKVEIKGSGVDLSFSIKGIGAVACGGSKNIPDGEVFSCPVKNSVEGTISYNAPTVYRGISFDNIALTFKKGKIVDARANNTKALNEILDSDRGARFIGEFAIGFNPLIKEPMRDILFDEKISGSFHFTPGQAYEEADNGNRSQVHWDMVHIQRPEYGGGSIYFDGKLIRKDGLFVKKDLLCLNPDQLLA